MQYTAERRREYMQQYREERRAWARKALGEKCVQCGSEEDLEFDHIDPNSKIKAVASMLTASWGDFVAEVLKCQLLCKEHHQQKTRRNLAPRPPVHGMERAYRKGCRCRECVVNQQARRKKYR